MDNPEIKSISLKPREERRLLRGHVWVYRNELQKDPGLPDGSLVDVFSDSRRFIGRGFYQGAGGIAVRLLTRRQQDIDPAFWSERLEAARAWRERMFPGQSVYRWVFGESDGLPGLVIDRYGSVAVCGSSSAFYALHAQTLREVLLRTDGIQGVVFQFKDSSETHGEVPASLECEMEGIRLALDWTQSQKTGLFLDQRMNSRHARAYMSGARVFDGHCYHGVWTCHAALAGAVSVTAVDTSEAALEQARRNAALNGVLDKCSFLCGEVEGLLQQAEYEVVILDPPAFAKTRAQAKKALARYQALNSAALRAVAPGGMLITSSCSHFVTQEEFLEIIKRAAASARRQAWLVEMRGAAPDHPVSLQIPETASLKCAYLRVW